MMNEAAFRAEVAQAIVLYEQAIHRPATRTWQMIGELGEVKALSRLMNNPDIQRGFKALRDSNQLDKTFEAVIVRYRELFTSEVIAIAQWRLDNPNWQD